MSKVITIDGLPVIDARRALKLHITPEHVKRASRKRPDNCAIAQTCLATPGVKEVRIHLSRAYLRSNSKNWQRFLVSPVLRSEIIAFDRGGKFAPGDYVLHKVTPTKRLGKRQGGNKKPGTARYQGGHKRRAYHVVTDVRTGPA